MIYLNLFLGFLKVGCFAFGGGYGAITLIRDVVISYGWLDEEMLTYMIAVSESTPGPIMVNLATYVGSQCGGLLGAFLATLAVVLPSFLIILLIVSLMKTALKNPWVQAVLSGMKPCVMGIILATGGYMICQNCISAEGVDGLALIITLLLAAIMAGYKKIRKQKISPILLIVISAVIGMIAYV